MERWLNGGSLGRWSLISDLREGRRLDGLYVLKGRSEEVLGFIVADDRLCDCVSLISLK